MKNPPAFPGLGEVHGYGNVTAVQVAENNFLWQTLHQGMTLRDYFAAKAMQGLVAQSMGSAMGSDTTIGAKYAYEMADAMLRERLKKIPAG